MSSLKKTTKSAADELAAELNSATVETVAPAEVQSVEQGSAIDPTDELTRAQNRALQASVQAAATMGDSTSGLFSKVEKELEVLRENRDQQLAKQIAQQVFHVENQTLGKSFTKLLEFTKEFDPYKGTALEGITGANTIDINSLLSGNGSTPSLPTTNG